ncbi:glycine cleavage system aminomethyltransferase GcvT [Halobacteriovorax sp. GB3]|uniref:glycine cleavage system aminomethyltransferase GcvT n=1 Tax=Halobacteriovorax sp. GB3 TaxID=2719615 RepID=UPI002361FC33|nr:glycine cleavage system aminomethyltransferase GcvT [Halobacteriovorax sp. GB3]MDD0854833.1 glycine cleavage system aminomethyltransferase GcvT [Halobacteriovorax sp. GB3]
MSLMKTSLHQKHIDLGAKMAPFAGFDMPLQYSSVKEESQAVRSNCGIFDVSHMGEFLVEGEDAEKFLDYMVTNDFSGAGENKAVYSPLCREDGTVIDDLIAYKLAPKKVLICVNAANIEKDWAWFEKHVSNFNCTLTNQSDEYSLIAVQGPKTEEIFKTLELLSTEEFPYYSVKESSFNGETVLLARTGYTGEDGFEVFCSHDTAALLWDKLIACGALPCGLAARDVLRLEVCYPLYGHEITDEVTPLDAALKWTVKLNKEDFIGKNALADYKPRFRLAKLSLDKGIPREGYEVLNADSDVIGKVVSGTMSVALGKGIALCHIEADKFPENKEFKIRVRKNEFEANYHTKSFINGGHK